MSYYEILWSKFLIFIGFVWNVLAKSNLLLQTTDLICIQLQD